MLVKLKTLIYENWFSFLSSLLISFLIYKNIFLVLPLALILSWHIFGSFLKAFFFSFVFLPSVLVFKNNFSFNIYFLIFIFIFFFLKKRSFFIWLSLFLIISIFFYLNFLNNLDISFTIIFSILTILFFNIVFLNRDLLSSLIYSLIFFELFFLLLFLPIGFYGRILIVIISLFLILKFDIINLKFRFLK